MGGESGDGSGVGRVERVRYESRIGTFLHGRRCPVAVDIGDDDMLENFGFRSRVCDRGTYASGSDDENTHPLTLRSMRRRVPTLDPTAGARDARRRCTSITTLTIAAQKHHNEMKPLTVIHMRIGTAIRLSTPSSAMSR